ncbi:hypothetical protein [Ureibacillus endophyticus]|uniref:Uncharacterized protein n=1 Tax=Ureibacillus endophyticus TaxID=1978490 RepID=A0A494YRR5_9BACL|nr:hypothetical protein [Lysinibacillus endophyticus]RKQ12138.1 hypothetical protein D8M03_17175 [Lysinibacillus endophyticus]
MEKTQWVINGEMFSPKIIDVATKPKFKESHTRVTTYLENNLHVIIKMLLEHGQIESISGFINESIKYYLMKEKNDFSSNDY